MLKIKTNTGRDSYGGIGLFAAEDIAAGTVVWVLDQRFTQYIPVEAYLAADAKTRADLDKYTYPVYDPEGGEVGLYLNLDDSRYMNHSEQPNTISKPEDPREEIAARDIKAGEELTCNYLDFDPENILYGMGVYSCKRFLLEDATPLPRKIAADR